MHIKRFLSVICDVVPRGYLGLLLLIVTVIPRVEGSEGCASFMLRKDGVVIAGHNLDSGEHTPGVVVINKRGIRKEGKSWKELGYGQTVPNPQLSWVSKYGSVTFNTFCRDFPDGGMNEVGLFIAEMSLMENKFPEDASKPLFFMMLWMQYVLDNFNDVEQVVQSAQDHVIDGWNWHFFTADRHGNAAAIEFIAGKPVIHQGNDLPYTVLCNETYDFEMELLQNYQGFGGDRPIYLITDSLSRPTEKRVVDDRFVRAARMLKEAANSNRTPMDYGFGLLEEMSGSGTQWSYVFDLTNQKVSFRTKEAPAIKELGLLSFDLSCQTATKMLDIHTVSGGPAERQFHDYTLVFNRACLIRKIEGWETVFTSNGSTLEEAADRISRYSESTMCR